MKKKHTKIIIFLVVLSLLIWFLPGLLEQVMQGPNKKFISPRVSTIISSVVAKSKLSSLEDFEIPQYDTYYYHNKDSSSTPWWSSETIAITQVENGKVVSVTEISKGTQDGYVEPTTVVTKTGDELTKREINSPETITSEVKKIDTCQSYISKSIFSNNLILDIDKRTQSIYCGYIPYGFSDLLQDTGFSPGESINIKRDFFQEGYYSPEDFLPE